MNYIVFIVALAAIALVNWKFRIDIDERPKGTPRRAWGAKAAFHKSLFHAIAAYALMLTAFALQLHVIAAAVIVFAGLLAFEYTQAYVDWVDIAANAAGIVAAVALLYFAPVIL